MVAELKPRPAIASLKETGGSPEAGPRSIHVQWRDVAGNWSPPLLIQAWAVDPAGSATPDDL